MSLLGNRVFHYLLSRQHRAARHEAFERAAEAGILEGQLLGDNARSGTAWQVSVAQATLFTGEAGHDRELVRTALEASSRSTKPPKLVDETDEFGGFDACEDYGELGDVVSDVSNVSNIAKSDGPFEQRPDRAVGNKDAPLQGELDDAATASARTPTHIAPNGANLAEMRDHVLSIVTEFAPAPKAADVATALLLARAVGRDERTLDRLVSVMTRKNPIIAVQVPVHDFVRQFGLMLEAGLILPFHTSLNSIIHGPTLSGRHKPLADSRRRKSIECLSGALARRNDDDDLRRIVSTNVLGLSKPVLIADESHEALPKRCTSMADIVIEGDDIDPGLVADVLAICCGIPVERSLFLMNEIEFEPVHLGIDDLAIAIRPGRFLTRILGVLMTLEADNAARLEDADEDGNKSDRNWSRRTQDNAALSRKRRRFGGCFDVIEPAATSAAGTKLGTGSGSKAAIAKSRSGSGPGKTSGSGSRQAKPVKQANGRDHLLVEQLAGYGEARQWALDLKLDLASWRNQEVEWSDLSSRLLLSGPPGTGKTTFARALCNTLQVPLVATSVARWLEPSHLGDVLAAIGATFEHVGRTAPCILFIDEIDNIGNRSSGGDRHGDDYWSSLINRLLELLDGTTKTQGVIVVGATNRPEKIDSALLRSGRLEKHIVIPPPDTEALIGIIVHHLGPDLAAVLMGSDAPADSDAPIDIDAGVNGSVGDGSSGREDAAIVLTIRSSTERGNSDGVADITQSRRGVPAHG